MDGILDKIKNTRLLAGIGVAGLILGTMLTYIKYSVFGYSIEISLSRYLEGKIVIALAVANLLFIFKDMVEKYVPSLFNTNLGKKISSIESPKASLVPTILAVVFIVYLHSRLDIDSSFANYGLGFYSILIGTISLVAYAFLNKKS